MKDKSEKDRTRPIGPEDIIRFINLLKKPKFPEYIDENEDIEKLLDGRVKIIEKSGDERIGGEVIRHIGKDTWKVAVAIGGSILIGMFLRREFYRLREGKKDKK